MAASPTARRFRAKYAATKIGELLRNVSLQDGEDVLFNIPSCIRLNLLFQLPAIVWITPQRLFILEHHLFSSDYIWEVWQSALGDVGRPQDNSGWVKLVCGDGIREYEIKLAAGNGRDRAATEDLANILQSFQSGGIQNLVNTGQAHK